MSHSTEISAVSPFEISVLPRIVFGAGCIDNLAPECLRLGRRFLLITGKQSFRRSPYWPRLLEVLSTVGMVFDMVVNDEPNPDLVDTAVQQYRAHDIDVVVGIGGGSVLDAAKAIAGLLPFGNSVLDHLEGVGKGIPYHGPALPFIAVPTTAGTGSEATKNAVLSERGEAGYKKSFRHETLVPKVALVDPELLKSCSAEQIAANGMDAFTQLLESYVSSRANPFTDALAWSGLQRVGAGFIAAWQGGENDSAAAGRSAMAYAALLSGITLAQVGLGSVHGLASPLGAFFPIPHGVACGTLVAEATRINIVAMQTREPKHIALVKYAQVGRLLTNTPELADTEARNALVDLLSTWTQRMQIPALAQFGVKESDVGRIVAASRGSSMQTNPIILTDEEIGALVRVRL